MTSTPLPERGGFNKRLDEILTAFANGEYSHHWTDNRLVYTKDEAKAAIRTLVLEEIIGEDEQQPIEYYDEIEKSNVRKFPTENMVSRNNLKAEQRKKLEDSNGTK